MQHSYHQHRPPRGQPSPAQVGYRDGWRVRVGGSACSPYARDSAECAAWQAGYREALADRKAGRGQ